MQTGCDTGYNPGCAGPSCHDKVHNVFASSDERRPRDHGSGRDDSTGGYGCRYQPDWPQHVGLCTIITALIIFTPTASTGLRRAGRTCGISSECRPILGTGGTPIGDSVRRLPWSFHLRPRFKRRIDGAWDKRQVIRSITNSEGAEAASATEARGCFAPRHIGPAALTSLVSIQFEGLGISHGS